jgi:hypothetical protein
MNYLDIIVSKLRRENYSQERAEEYSSYLIDICNMINRNPLEVIENFDIKSPLYEQINDFIMNNQIHRTYITGKAITVEPNHFIARTIL